MKLWAMEVKNAVSAGQTADDKRCAASEPGAALRYRRGSVMVMSVRHSNLLWPWGAGCAVSG